MGASVTSKADIWSLGAILYHLVYGRAPETWTPQPPFNLPPTRSPLVQDLLMNCLRRNPNKRPSHRWLAKHPLTSSPALG
jgi:serine/threonine protein kinase